MAQPTINDLHPVDPVLTNFALGYMNEDGSYVATRATVPVPVTEKSGTYIVFDKKYWFTDEMEERAPGAPYAEGGYGVSTGTYSTLQRALSKPIADEERAASQVPMDLETAAIKFLVAKSLIRKERQFAANYMVTGVWATDNTTATDWDDFAAGDPVSDFQLARRTVRESTGKNPNQAIMGAIVKDALLLHPDIIDRVKATTAATAASLLNALAAIIEIPSILVGEAIYNSANESAAMTGVPILDDDCLVWYQDNSAGVFAPTAAKLFHWAPGGGIGGIRPIFRDDKDDRDLVKFKMQWDMKVVATDLGYFFSDIV